MPIRVHFREDGGVIAEITGAVRARDLVKMNESLYETPEHIRAIRYQICDLTGVTDVDVPSAEMTQLAKQDTQAAASNPNMLIAMVGDRDLTYGLARMWEAYAAGPGLETMVFRNRAAAEEWIRGKLGEMRPPVEPDASDGVDAGL